jgi:hypothetical protein
MEPAMRARCVRAGEHATDACMQRWTVLCCEWCEQQWEVAMHEASDAAALSAR